MRRYPYFESIDLDRRTNMVSFTTGKSQAPIARKVIEAFTSTEGPAFAALLGLTIEEERENSMEFGSKASARRQSARDSRKDEVSKTSS